MELKINNGMYIRRIEKWKGREEKKSKKDKEGRKQECRKSRTQRLRETKII